MVVNWEGGIYRCRIKHLVVQRFFWSIEPINIVLITRYLDVRVRERERERRESAVIF